MGGRGGRSHRSGGGGTSGRYTAASYAGVSRTAQQLGIRLNLTTFIRNQVNPLFVAQTLQSVHAVYDHFPAMKGHVKYVDAVMTSQNAYASAGGDGGLHLGLYGRYTEAQMERSWANDVRAGFHPQGSKYQSIFVHEMGHQIEAKLNAKDFGNAWAWGKTADRVVLEAAQRIDPTITSLSDPKVKRMARQISGYAVASDSRHIWKTWETLAEAVQDTYDNGARAKHLSREIWDILKRRLK